MADKEIDAAKPKADETASEPPTDASKPQYVWSSLADVTTAVHEEVTRIENGLEDYIENTLRAFVDECMSDRKSNAMLLMAKVLDELTPSLAEQMRKQLASLFEKGCNHFLKNPNIDKTAQFLDCIVKCTGKVLPRFPLANVAEMFLNSRNEDLVLLVCRMARAVHAQRTTINPAVTKAFFDKLRSVVDSGELPESQQEPIDDVLEKVGEAKDTKAEHQLRADAPEFVPTGLTSSMASMSIGSAGSSSANSAQTGFNVDAPEFVPSFASAPSASTGLVHRTKPLCCTLFIERARQKVRRVARRSYLCFVCNQSIVSEVASPEPYPTSNQGAGMYFEPAPPASATQPAINYDDFITEEDEAAFDRQTLELIDTLAWALDEDQELTEEERQELLDAQLDELENSY